MATIVGDGIRLLVVGPSAITRAMFQEYLMCSSVVPAVPWMTRRRIAADRRRQVFAQPAFAGSRIAD